jgi:hypothetical protein
MADLFLAINDSVFFNVTDQKTERVAVQWGICQIELLFIGNFRT